MNTLALRRAMAYLAAMKDDTTVLAAELGLLLIKRDATVTAAESCTGGGVAEAITQVAGASAWFNCSFVTYSNHAKTQLLDVPGHILAEQGAVSEAVVVAMAQGARRQAAAGYAVAVSGIAGPGGGTPAKPVGTVWLAWADQAGCTARCCHFDGDRQQVRHQATVEALQGLINCVKKAV